VIHEEELQEQTSEWLVSEVLMNLKGTVDVPHGFAGERQGGVELIK
jgi:hypothetical protein